MFQEPVPEFYLEFSSSLCAHCADNCLLLSLIYQAFLQWGKGRAPTHMRSWLPWICFPSWLVDHGGFISFPLKISGLCYHTAEVSPVGSNISICLACLACCRQSCSIPCSFHQQLEHRKPSWSWCTESSSSSLVSAVRVSPSWEEKEEKQVLKGLADSKQGRLFAHGCAPLAFCPGRFYYFLFNGGILSRVYRLWDPFLTCAVF